MLIAETDANDPRLVEPPEAGGLGLDAMWTDDLHHALHVALTGERGGHLLDFTGAASEVADVLAHGYRYRGRWSPSRQRRHGRPLDLATPLHRLVAGLQNHDQVGNRARGERLGHLVDPVALYGASALVLTAPHVPLVFQGEEWAASTPFLYFTDHPTPTSEAVRRGRGATWPASGGRRTRWSTRRTRRAGRRRCGGRSGTTRPTATSSPGTGSCWRCAGASPPCGTPARARRGVGDDRAGTVVVQRGDVVVVADVGGSGGPVRVDGAEEELAASPGSRLAGGHAVLAPGGAVVARRRPVPA